METPNDEIISKAKRFLGNNQIKESIELLNTHSEINYYKNDLIQISRRLKDLKKKSIRNIASNSELTIEANQISDALLDLITQIEEGKSFLKLIFKEVRYLRTSTFLKENFKNIYVAIPLTLIIIASTFYFSGTFTTEPKKPVITDTNHKIYKLKIKVRDNNGQSCDVFKVTLQGKTMTTSFNINEGRQLCSPGKTYEFTHDVFNNIGNIQKITIKSLGRRNSTPTGFDDIGIDYFILKEIVTQYTTGIVEPSKAFDDDDCGQWIGDGSGNGDMDKCLEQTYNVKWASGQ